MKIHSNFTHLFLVSFLSAPKVKYRTVEKEYKNSDGRSRPAVPTSISSVISMKNVLHLSGDITSQSSFILEKHFQHPGN